MATSTRYRGTMFTTPSDRELVATHVVKAPRPLVFDAHTKPEHISRWMLGPAGWTMPVCEVDLRPGGESHYLWRHASGRQMEMRGEFREVTPPARLVHVASWGGDWEDTVNTLILTEDGDRTTLTTRVLYPSRKARDAARETGMGEGWARSYELLDERLLKELERQELERQELEARS